MSEAAVSMLSRRLLVALNDVQYRPVARDWDTPEGRRFLRMVIDAEHDGHDLDDLGRDLDVPNLRYVVAVWRKDLA